MSDKDTGGPAFPLDYIRLAQVSNDRFHDPIEVHEHYQGMTLRDYFAEGALIALIQKEPEQTNTLSNPEGRKYEEWMGGEAYLLADAMLKERNK